MTSVHTAGRGVDPIGEDDSCSSIGDPRRRAVVVRLANVVGSSVTSTAWPREPISPRLHLPPSQQ